MFRRNGRSESYPMWLGVLGLAALAAVLYVAWNVLTVPPGLRESEVRVRKAVIRQQALEREYREKRHSCCKP